MTEQPASIGVLFVATGDKYVRSATRCARSIQKLSPNLAIHLFTDSSSDIKLRSENGKSPFSSIDLVENPHRRSKVEYMARTPFEKTLFLDSDTDVVVDIREMFSLLDRFDIALAHAPKRNENKNQVFWQQPLPASFPQYNSGVVLYRMNPTIQALLADWQKAYLQAGFKLDQISLRECLWKSDARIATLPPEYNLRFIKYKYIWNQLEARPKIYHLSRFHNTFLQNVFSPFYRIYKLARYNAAKIKRYVGRKL